MSSFAEFFLWRELIYLASKHSLFNATNPRRQTPTNNGARRRKRRRSIQLRNMRPIRGRLLKFNDAKYPPNECDGWVWSSVVRRSCLFSPLWSRFFFTVHNIIIFVGLVLFLFDHLLFDTFQRLTLHHQLHVMRGKGAFQEENIPVSDLRNASQARDFID